MDGQLHPTGLKYNWPHSQIPCSIQNRNMHISVLNVAFWDMEKVHSGICEIGLLVMHVLNSRMQYWFLQYFASKKRPHALITVLINKGLRHGSWYLHRAQWINGILALNRDHNHMCGFLPCHSVWMKFDNFTYTLAFHINFHSLSNFATNVGWDLLFL